MKFVLRLKNINLRGWTWHEYSLFLYFWLKMAENQVQCRRSQVQAREDTVTSKIFEIIVFDWIFSRLFSTTLLLLWISSKNDFRFNNWVRTFIGRTLSSNAMSSRDIKVWAIWIEFHAITRKSALSENWLLKLCILLTLFLYWQRNAKHVRWFGERVYRTPKVSQEYHFDHAHKQQHTK